MTTSHVPGPWIKDGLKLIGSNGKQVIIHDGPSFGSKSSFPEAEANTKLVFAAPELLETLKNVVMYLEYAGPDAQIGVTPYNTILTKVQQAIIAATGKAY